jgi:outer membrane protein, heavy metal efflux system
VDSPDALDGAVNPKIFIRQERFMFRSTQIFIFCVFLLPACSGIGYSFETPGISDQPKMPPGGQYLTFQQNDAAPVADDSDTPGKNPKGVITLEQALALGLLQNPELASFSWEVRAAEARLIQEGLLPNPEVETSVENFGGNNDLKGFDGAETTVQVSQMIELGGKRAKRKQAALLDKDIAGLDYKRKRLDVFTDISKSFWDVVAAQEQFAISQECASVADNAYNLAAERVKAGKSAPLEEIQAKVATTTIRIEFERARRDLETARKKLAAIWGSDRPAFEKAAADTGALASPPPLENLKEYLPNNPDLARWDSEIEKSRAKINLADAGRIPDLTVGAGPRYFNQSDDTPFVMNLSVPIPLFNRNQGATQEARMNLAKARESQKAAMLKAQSDLEQAYQALSSFYLTADSLIKTAIPAAEAAFTAAREGYREGKIGYLAVLETQRTFFEVKHQYISAVADYHKSKADIERLAGLNLVGDK